MTGVGESTNGDDTIEWHAGDVFCFPGGAETHHHAIDGDCVLWAITNEPQLALEHAEPAGPGRGSDRGGTLSSHCDSSRTGPHSYIGARRG